jgi:ethanolamine utilization protein EutN
MIICQVIGHVWATKKQPSLEGFKLMVVRQEVMPHEVMVAVDVVGAGIGEQVLVVGGSTARRAAGKDDLPVDAVIVGIIDTIEVEKAYQANDSVTVPDGAEPAANPEPEAVIRPRRMKTKAGSEGNTDDA